MVLFHCFPFPVYNRLGGMTIDIYCILVYYTLHYVHASYTYTLHIYWPKMRCSAWPDNFREFPKLGFKLIDYVQCTQFDNFMAPLTQCEKRIQVVSGAVQA